MITLKNLTKRTVIFNLPHEVACSETVCTCSRVKSGVVDHDRATGDRKVRAVNQRLAHAITLFPKGAKEPVYADGKQTGTKPLDEVSGLLDGVARVPEIVDAKARFELEVTFTKATAEPDEKPEEPEGEPEKPEKPEKPDEPEPIEATPAPELTHFSDKSAAALPGQE